MENSNIENKNTSKKPESFELFEYKEVLSEMLKEISLLEEDWKMIEQEENKLPFTKKGIEVIEFLSSDKIADGPFIRNFHDDLISFLEKEDSKSNYSLIKKLVSFNNNMRSVQGIIWNLREEKDSLIKSMKGIKDSEQPISLISNKEILQISIFYITMKSLSSDLKDMINALDNIINL